jgi:hypothetical protein
VRRPPLVAALAAAACLAAASPAQSQAPCSAGTVGDTTTFSATGDLQCYVVPAGVERLQVVAVGEAGHSSLGGLGGPGATVTAELAVTPGDTLQVGVGLGAAPVNAGSTGVAGGGASDVRRCAPTDSSCPALGTLADPRLVVAGGGGGGGGAGGGGAGGSAGAGLDLPCNGAANGGPGALGAVGQGGLGGTCTGGGSGGAGNPVGGVAGGAGSPGTGGAGGFADNTHGGGGGGAGWFGGGGGGTSSTVGAGNGGGGGGGSSFGPLGAVFGIGAGPPSVAITPLAPEVAVDPQSLSFPSTQQWATSGPASVTISNPGNAALNLDGVSFGGAAAGDYFVGSESCGAVIAPGGSCELSLRFSPGGTLGQRAATLEVLSDAAAGSSSVALDGTAVAPPSPPANPSTPAPAGPAETRALAPPPPLARVVTRSTRIGGNRTIVIRVACRSEVPLCSGIVHLSTTRFGGGQVSLGTREYRLRGGRSMPVRFSLSPRMARRIRAALPARVRVQAFARSADTTTYAASVVSVRR